MTASIQYPGQLRTIAQHIYSGHIIETDAPLDNHGLAQRFSPTDLVATALGSCMLSIMGIAGNTHGINIDGMRVSVEKIMKSEPRRIGEIILNFYPNENSTYSAKEKTILEKAAHNCPVAKSLSSELVKTTFFHWK